MGIIGQNDGDAFGAIAMISIFAAIVGAIPDGDHNDPSFGARLKDADEGTHCPSVLLFVCNHMP